MRGHGHDRAGAVAHEHIIADPDGNLPAVDGIDCLQAVDLHAGLVLVQLGALEVALLGGLGPVGHDVVKVADVRLVLLDHGMLGADHHVGRAEQGVGTGGVDPQLFVLAGDAEVHLRAFAAADPVALLHLHPVDEVYVVQPVQQLLGIGGDLQHPLALDLAHHLTAAALAHAVDHFFVGQAALAAGAPVDGHFRLVGQPVFQKLEENPLSPLVIGGVGGVHLPGIVKAEAQPLELLPEVVDVLLGDDGGMHVVLDGEVLRGQAEGVVADGVQRVIALHAALAGDDVQRRIGAGMADVQPVSAGIGELDQAIVLGLVRGKLGVEHAAVGPFFLPLGFNGFRIILGMFLHRSSTPLSLG